jgi:hypothetical protein
LCLASPRPHVPHHTTRQGGEADDTPPPVWARAVCVLAVIPLEIIRLFPHPLTPKIELYIMLFIRRQK